MSFLSNRCAASDPYRAWQGANEEKVFESSERSLALKSPIRLSRVEKPSRRPTAGSTMNKVGLSLDPPRILHAVLDPNTQLRLNF